MMPRSEDLIRRFQEAYWERKEAKGNYVLHPNPDSASRYTAAVLAWDSLWSEMMSYNA